jgi:SAM-dependent methyltransferase
MPTRTEIEVYYKEFAGSVQLNDFRRVNLRHKAIKALCDDFVPDGSRVLEVGCGVGIISRHLARKASRVLSLDISETGIRIAKAHADLPVNEFLVLDVTEEGDRLREYGLFDTILLADVIEHIPKAERPGLFQVIENVLAPDGVVLLTYPSPEYQEYLRCERPEALQVVDETIELGNLLSETALQPLYYRLHDVWCRNQFVHLALGRRQTFVPDMLPSGLWARFVRKIKDRLWRWSNRELLKGFDGQKRAF